MPTDTYPLQDLLYRTTALTDDAGDIVETYDTDAYGNTLIFDAPGTGGDWWADDAQRTDEPTCEFIFTGRRYDRETGLYFYRARQYAPASGKFLQRDPVLYRDGPALYSLVRNAPTNYADPNGQFAAVIALPVAVPVGEAIGAGIATVGIIIIAWWLGETIPLPRPRTPNLPPPQGGSPSNPPGPDVLPTPYGIPRPIPVNPRYGPGFPKPEPPLSIPRVLPRVTPIPRVMPLKDYCKEAAKECRREGALWVIGCTNTPHNRKLSPRSWLECEEAHTQRAQAACSASYINCMSTGVFIPPTWKGTCLECVELEELSCEVPDSPVSTFA
jgi:RHS repeat-associated protein